MTVEVAAAVVAAAGVVSATLLLRAMQVAHSWVGSRSFRVRFPRNMKPEDVTTFFAGLAGLRPIRRTLIPIRPTVMFEVHAVDGRIEHYLHIPRAYTGIVLSQLRGALPSVRLDPPGPVPVPSLSHAIEMGVSTSSRPLRTVRSEALAAALLTSLQPLRKNERAVIQWIISPADLAAPPRLGGRHDGAFPKVVTTTGDGYELLPHAEALRAERGKQAEPLFVTVGRIGVSSAKPGRANYLLERLHASYQLLSASGVELKVRRLMSRTRAARRAMSRAVPLIEWPAMLNAGEIAGVVGWPTGLDAMPALSLGGCRQLPADAEIAEVGLVIGEATYPGAERPIALRDTDRLLHTVVTGPTGSGKSNLLLNLITQSMQSGDGVMVVDPKGDLVADCLDRVPHDRVRDVIVIDPADDDRPVGINLLDADAGSAELVVENVVYVFHQLFEKFWGPRTDDIMRAALLTLMRRPGMTLTELPLILTSAAWRAPFVAAIQDDLVGLKPFWDGYLSLRPNEMANVIAPLLNKARATLLRTKVRHCIGQAYPRFKFAEALDSKKLIFIPLRQGELGEDASALLGSLFIAKVWQTIQARSATSPGQRVHTHLFVDEAHKYVNLPTSLSDVLAQARGMGMSMTLATQHLSQWPTALRQDVLANARTKVIFQPTATDAGLYAKELKPYLTAEDLQGLGRYEIVAQLAVGQRVAPPVTAVTAGPPALEGHADAARAHSRQQYGQNRDELETAMRERHTVTAPPPPTGRKRRAQRSSSNGRSPDRSHDSNGSVPPAQHRKRRSDA